MRTLVARFAAGFSTWQLCGLGLLAYLCYLALLALYRLTLHPLAKFPGPFLSRISGIPTFVQTTTGYRHLTQWQEHRRYGPVVRVGPDTLSFSTPAALRQIYQSSRETNPLRKSPFYETIDVASKAYSVNTEISRKRHAVHRRIIEHGFSSSALRSNEPFIIDTVETLCRVLAPKDGEEWSEPRTVSDYCTWFAYDVMGLLVFGRQFNCLTDISHRHVPKMLVGASKFIYRAAYFPFQPLIRVLICIPALVHRFGGNIARDQLEFLQYCWDCVGHRISQEDKQMAGEENGQVEGRRDIMHYLLSARDPVTGQAFTREQLNSDGVTLIAAGSDTTSAVLAALFFYLTLPSSTAILEQLQYEVRSQFTHVDEIKGSITGTLPLLRACIDEALRMAPPVLTTPPRTIIQKGGLDIDGHLIPAGITVGVPTYVVHHNEAAYPDSWSFKPSRWQTDANNASQQEWQVDQAREAFAPFGVGSRGCVGKDLAYREMSACMARIIYLLDFRRAATAPGEIRRRRQFGKLRGGIAIRDDEFQLYDCWISERDGPDIEFRRRA